MPGSRSKRRSITTASPALVRRSTQGPLRDESLAISDADVGNIDQGSSEVESAKQHVIENNASSEDIGLDLSFLLQPSLYRTIPPSTSVIDHRSEDVERHSWSTCSADAERLYQQHRYYDVTQLVEHRLTQPPPPPAKEILDLFYLRLAALVHLGLPDWASQEARALEDIHGEFYRYQARDTAPSPDHAHAHAHAHAHGRSQGQCLLPWKLRILVVRLQNQDPGGYYALAADVRQEIQAAKMRSKNMPQAKEEVQLWMRRLESVHHALINSLIAAEDWRAALNQLRSLLARTPHSSVHRRKDGLVKLTLLNLRIGNVDAARKSLDALASLTSCHENISSTKTMDEMKPNLGSKQSPDDRIKLNRLQSIFHICLGDYAAASTKRQETENMGLQPRTDTESAKDDELQDVTPQDAISKLYTGHLDEAIDLLQNLTMNIQMDPDNDNDNDYNEDEWNAQKSSSQLTSRSPSQSRFSSTSSISANTYNLASCYELLGDRAGSAKKKELLAHVRRVAGHDTLSGSSAAGASTLSTHLRGLHIADFKLT